MECFKDIIHHQTESKTYEESRIQEIIQGDEFNKWSLSEKQNILEHAKILSPYYVYLYGNNRTNVLDLLKRIFEYHTLIVEIVYLFQYNFNKDCGYKNITFINSFEQFQLIADTLRYILYYDSFVLNQDILTNIFYKKYSHLLDINLCDRIVQLPYLIYNCVPRIFEQYIQNENYVRKFVQIYNSLQNIIVECDNLQAKEYCLKCQYDIIEDDFVEFDCQHQICQGCWVRWFNKFNLSYLPIIPCPWCKKETHQVKVMPENKELLLQQLPTQERLKAIFEKKSRKIIQKQCDQLSLKLLDKKYNLNIHT